VREIGYVFAEDYETQSAAMNVGSGRRLLPRCGPNAYSLRADSEFVLQ
jgi:hypothetical protein